MVRAMLVFTVLSASTHASAALRILTDALPVARVGVPYSVQLQAEGGLPPYTWTAAPLPRGLTLREDVIEGTPEVPDDHTGPTLVTITVRDRTSNDMASWTLALTVLVSGGLRMLGEPAGGVCTIGSQYLVNLTAHGGVRPYTWHTWGLPAGVSCDTGPRHLICVGYPVQSGAHSVGILLEDTVGERVIEEYVVDCIGDPPEIGPAHLLCAGVGRPYEEQLFSNYSLVEWSIVSGFLPPGLTMDTSGAIRGVVPAGTPTSKLFVFRVRATHERAGSSERDMAILTSPENVGCHSPDPENPGNGGGTGGHGGWGGDPGTGGTGTGGSDSGGSGASPGTAGSGGIAGARRPVRAQSGCDCSTTSAPDALLAAAALASLRRRRRRSLSE